MNTKMLQLAGCIILDKQGRILLLHRNTADRQQWEIPGGKIETGESAEQAAIREIKEELGVDVKIIKLLAQKDFTEDKRIMHYAWFQAEIVYGKFRIMELEKFDDLRYCSFEELKVLWEQLSPNTQNYLHYSNS